MTFDRFILAVSAREAELLTGVERVFHHHAQALMALKTQPDPALSVYRLKITVNAEPAGNAQKELFR